MKVCSLPYKNILEQKFKYANNNNNIHVIFMKNRAV